MPCEVTNESYALLRHTRVSYAKRKISFKTEPGEKRMSYTEETINSETWL